MDLESLKDRRNRFQVNRVDSVATGQHRSLNGDGGTEIINNGGGGNNPSTAPLIGFKDFNNIRNNESYHNHRMPTCDEDEEQPTDNTNAPGREEPSCAPVPTATAKRTSMSDRKGKRYGSTNRSTSFDIPEGADIDGPWNSPATLISHHTANSMEQHSTGTNGSGHPNGTHTNSVSYDTKYAKSFRHFTREALPRLDNYRNMMSIQAAYRPTLDELHDMTLQGKSDGGAAGGGRGGVGEQPAQGAVKFGWIKGVLVRCLLNIWGVMLFLRLSWCVGQAGIGHTWIIVCLATAVTLLSAISMSAISTNGQIKGAQSMIIILSTTVVTLITSISMAAISTNGVVKGGGTYYMISRSLGPEFGASIGLIFAVANAIAVAMYTVGFAESMVALLKSLGTYVVEDDMHSVRIIGSVAIVLLTGIVVVGMEWEATAQVGLLIILLAAMTDFVIGSFIGPMSDEEYSKGFVGFNGTVFMENLLPDYTLYKGEQQTFFSVFAIFFPAATGILAGANISGDLADPQAAIPKGTLLAIFITTISYLIFAVIAGATVVRDAVGNFTMPDWQTTFRDCPSPYNSSIDEEDMCQWGLNNSFQVMELVSASGGLIYAGCFAATLSSALASLVSAPKVFQALCNDKLYPYLEYFGKGYGKNNEPVRGYVLTFVIALAFILIAELNAIAPLISNFFLAAYALVNFSTFHASLAKPVGWRPTFKYYNMWLSLVGFVLCVAVMFLISWVTALLTFAAILFLYMVVIYRKPDVNWGSSTQAQTYKNALTSVQQLNNVDEHVKNYRPQILVLTGLPSARPTLVDFAYLVTKNLSLMVCGHTVKAAVNNRVRNALVHKAQSWFQVHKIKAFYNVVDDVDFDEGAKALLQASGVGKLRPNILLMGYKGNWAGCNREDLRQYFDTIHKALDMHLSVTILRAESGLDYSKKITFGDDMALTASPNKGDMPKSKSNSAESLRRNQSFSQISHELGKYLSAGIWNLVRASSGDITPAGDPSDKSPVRPDMPDGPGGSKSTPEKNSSCVYRSIEGGDVPRDVMESLQLFQKKHKYGIIDVWWLYDDGGLTLLLPYIINTRSTWSTCKLRVFALANKKDEFDEEQRSMAGLLAKFRIDYSDLKVIPDINKKPQESTSAFFDKLVADFQQGKPDDGESEDAEGVSISETELALMKDKTNRHMRLRELLQEHSKESSLVVMTLPMPRKGVVSAPLYMAWLELLTNGMPPFLLVRGNQTSVLTFYS